VLAFTRGAVSREELSVAATAQACVIVIAFDVAGGRDADESDADVPDGAVPDADVPRVVAPSGAALAHAIGAALARPGPTVITVPPASASTIGASTARV
jgi:hypothetical protein